MFSLPRMAEQTPPRLFVANPEAFDLDVLAMAQGTSRAALDNTAGRPDLTLFTWKTQCSTRNLANIPAHA